ncbi:MAG: acyl-CoA thioesterase [candidate division Zixibacteria bacterium]|nr:acyl-CoA thioesterase [candidate division Zixibacteria bacterium]
MAKSRTHVVKLILPYTTNHIGTLFGGTALQWMDEVASITANRYSRQEFVTVSLDKIDFTKPIPAGTIVELIGSVSRVGRTSIQVKVEIFLEKMFEDGRESAVNGIFTMVAVGADRRPVKVI